MSGSLFLDWAVLAVSLCNTFLLLWLGLTVLFNAERRTRGIWLAGGGLLLGGVFFLSHSAILGFAPDFLNQAADFWWRLGWIPVIVSPFAWYVVMLWYTGFWECLPPGTGQNPVHRRHRSWLILLTTASVVILTIFLFANPLPSFDQITHFDLSASLSLWGIPILILLYPLFILTCISLSLDTLFHPGPTVRMMGNLARRRARPWLIAASFVLLLVSLLVGAVMMWVVFGVRQNIPAAFLPPNPDLGRSIAWMDLLISTLIGISVALTGQAAASYEVFTGKALPRRGLLRYWHRALILAVGYSGVVGLSITLDLHPIYNLLISTCLLILFYSLLSWLSYAERERFIEHLRPFVDSQQLYEQILKPPSEIDFPGVKRPFYALCASILGAQKASLVPADSLAPLFGQPLIYPADAFYPVISFQDLAKQLSPQTLCIPMEIGDSSSTFWAVPLWNERGLSGTLLLSEKQDRGLYTQEEMEIARSVGERLMDMQISAEMSRRLMSLQRQQLTESQVIDRRAQRTLHDDVLPSLHAAMLTLSNLNLTDKGGVSETLELLGDTYRQITDLLRDLSSVITPELARLGLVEALRQVIYGELKDAFDEVTWEITPEASQEARSIPPLATEVLFYATRETIRNVAHHARPDDARIPLRLRVSMNWKEGLEIMIEDNGVGIQNAVRPDHEGGHGLALHSTMLAVIGGSLSIESTADASTRVRLALPVKYY
jgi:signal transduction histidine kinase